jgi:hypothetical protein
MSIASQQRQVNAAFDEYRKRLDTIPDELFTESPKNGGWSYSEVYSHILQADMASSMALERCARPNGKPTSEKPSFRGKLVLFFGCFPPWNVKTPESIAARMPVQKISKEEARNLLIKCRTRVNEMVPLLKDSPENCRMKHPRLGMLNARQWYKFIMIHTKHHIKQLNRIEKIFQS